MKIFKRILLSIACVSLLLACTKPNNEFGIPTTQTQNPDLKSATTKSVAQKFEFSWVSDVYCDGVWVDYLEGTGYGESVDHYKNGVWQEWIQNFKGTGTNLAGETFKFSEQDKIVMKTLPIVWTAHTTIRGDKGTIYHISYILNLDENFNFISGGIKNANCAGNTN